MADLSELIAKIQRAATEVPPKAGEKMLKESKDLVADAMGQWYGSYGPRYYNRTYGLYGGIIADTDASASGNLFTLRVDSGAIPTGSNKRDNGDYRFEGAFKRGYHGTSHIAVSTPPPQIYEPELVELGNEKLAEALDEYMATV